MVDLGGWRGDYEADPCWLLLWAEVDLDDALEKQDFMGDWSEGNSCPFCLCHTVHSFLVTCVQPTMVRKESICTFP